MNIGQTGRHAAASWTAAPHRVRAWSSSATSSANAGMLPSRSIMVGSAPKRLMVWAYKSHTGSATGASWVSTMWSPLF